MSEDILQVKDLIRQYESQLTAIEKQLRKLAEERADAMGAYDKKLGIVEMQLRNGKSFVIDGKKISDPPVTLAKDYAKSICFQEKIYMEKADTMYRNATKVMESIKAKLNGEQSIYRHLEE